MDSQAGKKIVLQSVEEAADTSSSSEIQRAPENRVDYASEDTSPGQPQGTVAPAVTPVAQPTSPARDEDQSDPNRFCCPETIHHDWRVGGSDSNGSQAAAAPCLPPSSGPLPAAGAE